jgi:hypothetical protein
MQRSAPGSRPHDIARILGGVSFPWLDRTPPSKSGAAACTASQLRELRDRAALYYRLGFTPEAATARLVASVAWEHESRRAAGPSDEAIATAVRETYARKPSGGL